MSLTPPFSSDRITVEIGSHGLCNLLGFELDPALCKYSVFVELPELSVMFVWLKKYTTNPVKNIYVIVAKVKFIKRNGLTFQTLQKMMWFEKH